MGKNQDPDPGSQTGMNNPEHIAKSLKTIFWVKILNSLMGIRDPGWWKFGSWSGIPNRDEQPGNNFLG
jgi:hypothetical protein